MAILLRGTILAILVEGHPRNISLKLFEIALLHGGDVVLRVFLFLALGGILFNGADLFSNFGRGSSKEHSCEIILQSAHLPRRRCYLNVVFFYF